MKSLGALFAVIVAVTAVQPVAAKTISLLDGRLSLEVPNDFSAGNPRKPDPRFLTLTSLNSPNRRLSVLVTYGKHIEKIPDAKVFLQYEVTEYARLRANHPRFQWLERTVIRRDGREWAEVTFVHDLSSHYGTEAYTRVISTFCDERLLDILALTRAAQDPAQRGVVDGVIRSVKLRP